MICEGRKGLRRIVLQNSWWISPRPQICPFWCVWCVMSVMCDVWSSPRPHICHVRVSSELLPAEEGVTDVVHCQEDVLRVPHPVQVSLNIQVSIIIIIIIITSTYTSTGPHFSRMTTCLLHKRWQQSLWMKIRFIQMFANHRKLCIIQINAVTKSSWEYLQMEIGSIPSTFLLLQSPNTKHKIVKPKFKF